MSDAGRLSRRDLIRSGTLVAAGAMVPETILALAAGHRKNANPSPVRLGLASYTFRNFTRAQLIRFMKQLNISELNAKDVMNLRNQTGLPMMACKAALLEAGGDPVKAEELLRKQLKGKATRANRHRYLRSIARGIAA